MNVDALNAVNSFIACPECGSKEATLEMHEGRNQPTDSRGVCPDCGFETRWLHGGPSVS